MSRVGEIGLTGTGTAEARLFATPRARKLARERGISLAQTRGSGPRGRIIAADIGSVAEAPQRPDRSSRIAAVGMIFDPTPIATLRATLARAGLNIDLEDVIIRAVSAALTAAREAGDAPIIGLSVRSDGRDLRLDDAATMSLSAIHQARGGELSSSRTTSAAGLSLEVVDGRDITAILLPPLDGFEMRLMMSIGDDARATLFFHEARVSLQLAAAILAVLKPRLELPVLLLV